MKRGITLWIDAEKIIDNLKAIGALKGDFNEDDVKSAIHTAVTITQHTGENGEDTV